ncbi:MAG: VOC family protein [Sphingomonadales bacterium]|nr:VOC family protein [Sphingomonadales bacterium]
MKLIDRFGDIFQLSYVAKDRDVAVAHASARLGIANFFCFDGKCPVRTRNGVEDLVLKVAVANTGAHQFEIIEPVSGPTWIYTEGRDLERQALALHHIGIAVVGPYSTWQETMAALEADGDEIVQISQLATGEQPQAMFAYVDNRATLGHFTEYLWWAPKMNGTPTMPAIRQGA